MDVIIGEEEGELLNQQAMLIAPLCGWTACRANMPESNTFEFFSGPSGIPPGETTRTQLPLYSYSLDDCRDMEGYLTRTERILYMEEAIAVSRRARGNAIWNLLRLAPASRVKAFLKAKGLKMPKPKKKKQ